MSQVPTSAQLQAVRARLPSFVYFTRYEIYFDHGSRQYTYQEGNRWVTRLAPPPGVSLGLLETSPVVAMDFYDAPSGHHASVVRRYPRDWPRPDIIMASVR
jgi:hypothetical protein